MGFARNVCGNSCARCSKMATGVLGFSVTARRITGSFSLLRVSKIVAGVAWLEAISAVSVWSWLNAAKRSGAVVLSDASAASGGMVILCIIYIFLLLTVGSVDTLKRQQTAESEGDRESNPVSAFPAVYHACRFRSTLSLSEGISPVYSIFSC